MDLSDGDLEFLLQLYDTAKTHISEKARQTFANDFVFRLEDYGIDVHKNAKEIGEHDEYLDKAITEVIESDEDYESDDELWFDEDDDYWDDDE